MRLRRRKVEPSVALVRVGNGDQIRGPKNKLRAELEVLKAEKRDGLQSSEALVASGRLVTHGNASYLRRLIQPWQIRAFGYYDLLGEIKYASQFYSRALSNLRIFAAEMNDEGELVPSEDPKAIAAVKRIKDSGGAGTRGLFGDYGRLIFLVGEALLFVWWNPENEMEQWEMLSTDELRLLDGDYTRFRAPMLPAMNFQPAPDDAYVPVPETTGRPQAVAYRLWKRHPRFSELADSSMEGVLELCEELVLLTHAVRARARSRLAGSGILFIDDRITTRPQEAVPDEDALEDPFMADLTEAMTTPLTDEGSASSVVPLVARVKVPDDRKLSDLVHHLQIIDPMQLYPETGLRMECVRRIAICLDMPPEQLLGIGDLNHWNLWGIDEQSWKYHLQPIAEGLVSDLTNAYLRPYLKSEGVQEWDRFAIDFDASKVINHPDRSKDAKDLHDRAVIGDTALRESTGFTEDDKPTDDELNRIIGMNIKDGSLALFGEPAPRGGTIETSPGVLTNADAQAPTNGAEVVKGPPPGGPPSKDDAQTAAAMIAGAAGLAVLRARETAGSRIRTAARRNPELAALIDGVAPRDVAATLGRQRVRELTGQQEAILVEGARPLILEAIRSYGVRDDVAVVVADAISQHAVRYLYDQRFPLLPDSFDAFVQSLLTAA